MPPARITELLHEVNRATGFASAFTNLRTGERCEAAATARGPIDRGNERPPPTIPAIGRDGGPTSQKSTPIWRSSLELTIFGFTASRRCHGFFCTAPEYPIPAPVSSATTLSRLTSRFTAPPMAR